MQVYRYQKLRYTSKISLYNFLSHLLSLSLPRQRRTYDNDSRINPTSPRLRCRQISNYRALLFRLTRSQRLAQSDWKIGTSAYPIQLMLHLLLLLFSSPPPPPSVGSSSSPSLSLPYSPFSHPKLISQSLFLPSFQVAVMERCDINAYYVPFH